MQTAETIRSSVAAARLALPDDLLQQNARTDLMTFLKSRGLLETENQPLLHQVEDRHDPVSIHMCPWHTCANTRHG
jgi:hypothetical protein